MNEILDTDVICEDLGLPDTRYGSVLSYSVRDVDNRGRKVSVPFLAIKIDDSDWFPAELIVKYYLAYKEGDA